MLQLNLLIGSLAALGHLAHGLQFNDRIKQTVGGEDVRLLHDADPENPTTVMFGNSPDPNTQGWTFNTEGFADDEAVISPLNSPSTLACDEGNACYLDLEGARRPFRVTRVDEKNPIFTFQDIESSLYLHRTPELTLELSPVQDETIYMTLEKIIGKNIRIFLVYFKISLIC